MIFIMFSDLSELNVSRHNNKRARDRGLFRSLASRFRLSTDRKPIDTTILCYVCHVPVRIVTDSTADLPQGLVDELGIVVVPLHIYFGDESFEDGVTISKDEFYRRLTAPDAPLPRTSAPPAGAFCNAYERLAQETDEIVSIHISPKLSATYNSALVGKEGVRTPCHIEVIDNAYR